MSFTVQDKMVPLGDNIYYDQGFRNEVENHLNLLKRSNTQKQLIEPDVVYQFEGNFYGYLRSISVPNHLHWIYLRVNGFSHPTEFGKAVSSSQGRNSLTELLLPDLNFVEQIKILHLTRKK